MNLPIFQTALNDLMLMQTRWASVLNVLLNNASLQSNILKDVKLIAGNNSINHGLGRNLQGWRVVRINGVASLYDLQAQNAAPNLTLILNSSAPVTVNLEVF
jgi:hypothetical protein